MAIVIYAPNFSFLPLSADDAEICSWSDKPCLPILTLSDLAFQVVVEVTGDDKTEFECVSTSFIASILNDCPPTDDTVVGNFTSSWELQSTGEGDDPDIWIGNFEFATDLGFTGLDSGTCFSIGIFYYTYSSAPCTLDTTYTNIACVAQCFTKIIDECYTSLMVYRNNENAFYFDYELNTSFFNIVRLPFYLHSRSHVEEEKSYQKSNGSTVKLMHRIWSDYKVKTDYWGKDWHTKFIFATAHDIIYITCSYVGLQATQFIRTEKVDIAWMEEDSPGINVAQAKTVLRAAEPLQNVNSNCN